MGVRVVIPGQVVSIGAKGLSRSRDRATFHTGGLCYRDYTRSSDPESWTLPSLPLPLPPSLPPLRNHAKWTAFSKAAAPSFFLSVHARYNNVTRILPSLFFFFFEKHIYNGRCVFYFFFFLLDIVSRDISVKISATIFTSFQFREKIDDYVCIFIQARFEFAAIFVLSC